MPDLIYILLEYLVKIGLELIIDLTKKMIRKIKKWVTSRKSVAKRRENYYLVSLTHVNVKEKRYQHVLIALFVNEELILCEDIYELYPSTFVLIEDEISNLRR